MRQRNLPIGIQDFEKLITNGFIYVDKTDYIYNLIQQKTPIFLSRPRRFGKSLLTSTMRAYWEGKKELFKNLKIIKLRDNLTEQHEQRDREEQNVEQGGQDNNIPWLPHPVFYFDFNGVNYQEGTSALENKLKNLLTDWEAMYGDAFRDRQLGERFYKLLQLACEKTGSKAVVLVDEYDKPLLDVLDEPELKKHNKAVFKGFFSVLKEADRYLQFVFITGVTKFEKVSIFSDLNQLRDISFSKEYTALCGITEQEITEYFSPEIEAMAEEQGLSIEECLARLKQTYDGYHFHQIHQVVHQNSVDRIVGNGDSVSIANNGDRSVGRVNNVDSLGIYNPFSLLNAFADKDFRSYWFSTGTPTFLVNKMAKCAFDVRKLTDKTLYSDEQRLSDYRANNPDLIPLLYQTGYLTIVDYDAKRKRYTLAFPNEEVKYGMLNSLLPAYAPRTVIDTGLDIFSLDEALEEGDLERVKNIFIGLFAMIPYPSVAGEDEVRDPFENYFQSVFEITFLLLGQYVSCEKHTATGRIDCIVKTSSFIYIFEFKRDGKAEDALKQIEEKGYALPFVADHERKLFKIGVVFDSKKRMLKEWRVAEGK